MKTRWIIVLTLTSLAGAPVRSDEKAGDKDNIQGNWSILFVEGNGEKVPAKKVKGKIIITATKITFTFEKEEAAYKLDPSKKPKQFDLVAEGKTIPGIYLLEGDNLKLCWDASDKAIRPTRFNSKGGPNTDYRLLVLKREKKK
jgi:uncharacterized protein (TIGR03067 family)